MKATRPDGGYVFHGGCGGCTQPLEICPACCYMGPNWSLPDQNQAHKLEEDERQSMMDMARAARLRAIN